MLLLKDQHRQLGDISVYGWMVVTDASPVHVAIVPHRYLSVLSVSPVMKLHLCIRVHGNGGEGGAAHLGHLHSRLLAASSLC